MSATTLSSRLNRHLLEGFSKALQITQGQNPDAAALQKAAAFPQADMNEKELVSAIHTLLAENPVLSPLSEYFFDLGIMHLISAGTDRAGDAYFDTPAWTVLEEQTLDRGTELLNVLVYLRDCSLSGVKPGIGDFLNEFLLVDEDEFQDEFFIYEPFIRNQAQASGAEIQEIIEVGKSLQEDETRELYAPVMWFFANQDEPRATALEELIRASNQPLVHAAIFNMLIHFAEADSE